MEDIDAMNDGELARAFLIKKTVVEDPRFNDLELMLTALTARLKKRGITKKMIYQDYKTKHPDGFKHSSF